MREEIMQIFLLLLNMQRKLEAIIIIKYEIIK